MYIFLVLRYFWNLLSEFWVFFFGVFRVIMYLNFSSFVVWVIVFIIILFDGIVLKKFLNLVLLFRIGLVVLGVIICIWYFVDLIVKLLL